MMSDSGEEIEREAKEMFYGLGHFDTLFDSGFTAPFARRHRNTDSSSSSSDTTASVHTPIQSPSHSAEEEELEVEAAPPPVHRPVVTSNKRPRPMHQHQERDEPSDDAMRRLRADVKRAYAERKRLAELALTLHWREQALAEAKRRLARQLAELPRLPAPTQHPAPSQPPARHPLVAPLLEAAGEACETTPQLVARLTAGLDPLALFRLRGDATVDFRIERVTLPALVGPEGPSYYRLVIRHPQWTMFTLIRC
jgi:hypothetical protein